MRARTVLHLSWALVATGAILLEVIIPTSTNPGDWMWPFGLLPFPLAGALILIQRPGNRIGRVLTAIGVAAGFTFAGGWLALSWPEQVWSPYLEAVISPAVVVMFWGMVALLYLLPTGVTIPGWPRWSFRAVTAVMGLTPALFIFRPGPMDISAGLDGFPARDNPLGLGPAWFADIADPAFGIVAFGGVVGLVALVVRFWRSSGMERVQLKVFLVGAVALVILLGLISPLGSEEAASYEMVLRMLVIAGFWGLPLAVVVAVLRYRLFEIDRMVSRSVTYLVTVALLGLVYTGLVVGLRELLPVEGDLPVALSTLVVALAFLPLVRRVQRIVDRRFFRSRYDASVVVARVAEDLRASLDLAEVVNRAEGVVSEVFAPESVSIWLEESGTPT